MVDKLTASHGKTIYQNYVDEHILYILTIQRQTVDEFGQ
ncbi:MAG: hypothetical protein EZS28_009285, partial [Streblomastix strix]